MNHFAFILSAFIQLLLVQNSALGQEDTKDTQLNSIVRLLSNGSLEGAQIGMMGHGAHTSEQYTRFRYLSDSASTDELAQLTNHSSPVVRCYAFDALAMRCYPKVLPLAQSHFNDTIKVERIVFDMVSTMTVAEYIKRETLPHFMRRWEPTPKDHDLLKDLCQNKTVPSAIVSLARLRNPEDESIILQYLADKRMRGLALEAIVHFPSEKFFSDLKSLYEEQLAEVLPRLEVCAPLYQSLLKYPSKETLSMLEKGSKLDDYFSGAIHRVAIYVALKRNNDEYYSPLRESLNLSEVELQSAQELLKEE
jgi:hypothetical protein